MKKATVFLKFLAVIFFMGFYSCFAIAEHELFKNFEPDSWPHGLHFFAGLGVNASAFQSDSQEEWLAFGSNFKADIGWYFNYKWAVETSGIIKFNRSKHYLFWDSLFTLGVRHLFDASLTGYSGIYARVFGGYAPTVAYPEDRNVEGENVDRIFFEGPAVGFGAGRLFSTSAGTIWFIDGTLSAQFIGKKNLIAMDGNVPVVISNTAINDNSTIYSFYLTAGILLF